MSSFDLGKISVLIIDDNRHMHAILKILLNSIRIKDIRFCDDPLEGLEEMRRRLCDILLLDYEMSPINGAELARMIRRDSQSPDPFIPILMITGHSEKHRIVTARDAGVNEILAKPVSVEQLYKRIVYMVEHERPFIKAKHYQGPDRRRRTGNYEGQERRANRPKEDQTVQVNRFGWI